VCKPLADSTIRKDPSHITKAYKRAIRWKWVSFNPAVEAEKPAPSAPDPQLPTVEEAAALVNECWRWGDLGPFVWVAMTTGARRGEMCALRWENLQCIHEQRGEHDCVAAGCRWILVIGRAIAQTDSDGYIWEKDTKTHQRRYVALEPETVAVLAEHRRRYERAAREAGHALATKHYMFSRRCRWDPTARSAVGVGAVQAVREAVGHRHHAEVFAALLGYRACHRRRGHPHGGRVARAWRRWHHHAEGVRGLGVGGRSARLEGADVPYAGTAGAANCRWESGNVVVGRERIARACANLV
jgi:integrase